MLPLFLISCASGPEWTEEGPELPGSDDAGSLVGLVEDLDGVALEGVLLTTLPGGREARSDSAGAFRIERLRPGELRVFAAQPGYDGLWSDPVLIEADGELDLSLRLSPASPSDGLLTVQVRGPDGLPLEGAQVGFDGVEVLSDSDGQALFSGLGGRQGELTVSFGEQLWPATTDVEVPALGSARVSLALAGRASESSGFLGSEVCGLCHPDVASSVADSAHAQALGEVEGALAEAFEQGRFVALGPANAWLTGGSEPAVVLGASGGELRSFPVEGVIGGEERGAVPWTELDGEAWPLPLAWVPPDPQRPDWEGGRGGWQAFEVERWFEASGAFAILDQAQTAEARCFGCHSTGWELDEDGLHLHATTGGGRYAEPGVGCERCHGAGQEHLSASTEDKPWQITNPALLQPERANEVCGQCHAALAGEGGSPYATSADHGLFRPGAQLAEHADSAFLDWPVGAAAVPGAQADELPLSGHGAGAWRARCSDCHAPHGSTLPAMLRADHRDNTLCLDCHAGLDFPDNAALQDHSGHALSPSSAVAAGRCTGCHMPDTAARLGWNDATGAGDLASHFFVPVPPAETVADFDAAGLDTLPAGAFTPEGCASCHAFGQEVWPSFPGPTGEPTSKATHEGLAAAWDGMFP